MTLATIERTEGSSRTKRAWSRVTLGELCRTSSGGTPSRTRPDYFTGTIPWVKSGELTDGLVSDVEEFITDEGLANSSAKVFPAGTLLVALYGATVGKLGVLTRAAATNQAVCAIFPPPELESKFLFWYLRHRRADLIAQAIGGAQPNISQSILRSLDVPVPPVEDQLCIVAEIEKQFSRLDEAVANLKRVKANLKRYKAAVLKAAVEGRLVPTEAELARREGRSYETGAQLLQRIVETHRSEWKGNSKFSAPKGPIVCDLPTLPTGWIWVSAMQACERVVDCHNKTAPYTDTGIPLARTTNIRDGRLLIDDLRYVDQATYEFWSRRCPPQPGDVLFTREAPMGEAAIIPPGLRLCLGQRTMLLRPSSGISAGFLLASLISPVVKGLIERVAVGSGVKHLRVGDVERLPIPLAPVVEQQRIVAEVDRRLSFVREVETEVDANLGRAQGLRQATLQAAFTVPQLAGQ